MYYRLPHLDPIALLCKASFLRILSCTPCDSCPCLARLAWVRSERRLCLSISCLRGRMPARGISWIDSTIFRRILHGKQAHFGPMAAATAVFSPTTALPQSKRQHIKRNNGIHPSAHVSINYRANYWGVTMTLCCALYCTVLYCTACPKTTAMGA